MPIEPPPSIYTFPPASRADAIGLVCIGGDLEPGALLMAYRAGLFPMPVLADLIGWWSPDPRAIFPLDHLHISRSLRRTMKRFDIRINTAFEQVIEACSNRGEGDWISDDVREAYMLLHRLGWAHSFEAWSRETPSALVGGLYGVAIGGLFAGESMFHRERDASKAALVGLVDALRADGHTSEERLLDTQWLTPHLGSLGAVEIRRTEYLVRLEHALTLPLPEVFTEPGRTHGSAPTG